MKLYDMIHMCLQNLLRRKVRTMLTVVGVIVGTCAIVVMISIGIGMKQSQEEMLAQMGDLTVIEIYSYGNSKDGKEIVLNDEALSEISRLSGVLVATPFYRPYDLNIKLVAGKNDRYVSYMNLVGIYPEALPFLGFETLEGDLYTAFDEPYSMVFGQYADYSFRDTRKRPGYNMAQPYPDASGKIPDPIIDITKEALRLTLEPQKDGAKKIELKTKVTGRLKEDWGKGYETSRGVFMNIYDLKRIKEMYNKENGIKPDRNAKEEGYENAKVKVADIKFVAQIEEYIQDMGFDTYSMESIRKPMEEQARQQQMVLGSLGAISLFVAAIGITNTMVMSIYERTREIGVMKVVGCYLNDIRTVFLMEAGLIGFMGGVIGVIISYMLSFMMNHFGFSLSLGNNMYGETATGAVSVIPLWLVAMAIVFATFIGLVSGYYPANRAVKISALSAIKQD